MFSAPSAIFPRTKSKACGRKIKAEEKAARPQEKQGLLADVPVTLPGLTRAVKLQSKASTVGFDWNDARLVLDKIREETREIEAALDAKDDAAIARRDRRSSIRGRQSGASRGCRSGGRDSRHRMQNSSAASAISKTRSLAAAKTWPRSVSPKWTSSGTTPRRARNSPPRSYWCAAPARGRASTTKRCCTLSAKDGGTLTVRNKRPSEPSLRFRTSEFS